MAYSVRGLESKTAIWHRSELNVIQSVLILVEGLPFINMDCSTVDEHVKMIKFHFENGDYSVSTFKALWACDLTPCDFFQWGYQKDCVTVNNRQNPKQYKTNVLWSWYCLKCGQKSLKMTSSEYFMYSLALLSEVLNG